VHDLRLQRDLCYLFDGASDALPLCFHFVIVKEREMGLEGCRYMCDALSRSHLKIVTLGAGSDDEINLEKESRVLFMIYGINKGGCPEHACIECKEIEK
jgi:hypothetical protein